MVLFRRVTLFGMLVAALVLTGAADVVAQANPRTILVLFSNARLLPANVQLESGLRAAVATSAWHNVDVFAEFLDVPNFGGGSYDGTMVTYLRNKYAARPPDVIVVAAEDALGFLVRYRGRLFPGVPIVHVAVSRSNLGELPALPADVIGVLIEYDFAKTIEQALKWHPGARRLVIVTGASVQDLQWEAQLRTEMPQFAARVTPEFLAGLPTSALLQRLRMLGNDAVVFTPGYFKDGDGRVSTPRDAVTRITSASSAPVYGPFDTFLGTGIVGGFMPTFKGMGQQAGEIAVALLAGVSAASLRVPDSVPAAFRLDWRQAQRWKITERDVPSGTVWYFREATLWEAHYDAVIFSAFLIALQAGLISALLMQRRSRRRAVEALRENEERMILAAQAAELSLWIWDFSRDRLWGTGPSWRPIGAPLENPIVLQQALEVVHPADRNGFHGAMRHAATTGEDLDAECRVMRPDGEVRWVAARGRIDSERRERLLGVTFDITRRRLAELQAEADRTRLRQVTRASMLGQLSASIAHQVNQPLAAILGNAEALEMMLGRDSVDRGELKAICADIIAEDLRAAEVIRRLRALYTRGELRPERVDLNALLGETLALVQPHLLARRVDLVLELDPLLSHVHGDPIQLQQGFLNLILNATDAMSEIEESDRMLTIRTEPSGSAAKISVIDSGPGIADDDLANIFEPFWSTKRGGMGVGLAICESIVVAHHGSVTASSEASGGATFCVI